MADVNQKHVTALVAKTNRWVTAMDRTGALETPALLVELEHSGPVGKILADEAWARLAVMVGVAHGKPASGKGAETAPNTTRRAIAQECLSLKARRTASPEELAEALAGLPR
jgi:hypothetical protein